MTVEATHPSSKERRGWNRLALALLAVGLVTLTVASYLIYESFNSGSGFEVESAEPFGPSVSLFEPPPAPTATEAPPLASTAPISRLTIPKYDVSGNIIVMGVDEHGVMETPEDPWDIAWYDFTGHPGHGSNAVFSGHVDWTFDTGPAGAIFWHLKDLVQGDIIGVELEDGTSYQYSVISREQVDPETADIPAIVGATDNDVVTLITCGGPFDPVTRRHQERTIVRAELVPDAASAAAPSAAGP